MKCKKCGKRLRNNEKFCTYCGYYNDSNNAENWTENESEDDLLNENWYDDELDTKDEENDEVDFKPVKKKKEKKNSKKGKEEKTKKPKKEKEVKEIKLTEEKEEVFYTNEKYLEAYIGEDYKIIKKSPFNIYAFLLNWMYFLYRKLYITGIIGLIITALVAFFLTKYFLIYLIIVLIVIGFGFNPYYIFISKKKVEKILVDYEGSDSFSLEKICSELGGVNVFFSLVIYLIFLVVIIFSIVKVNINTDHNPKFWKENSENRANCISLARVTYQEVKENYNKVEEALCKIDKNTKQYELYLKTTKNNKKVYVYYETENDYIVYKNDTELLDTLNKKKQENNISIEEETLLSDLKMITVNYENIRKKSLEEDKLIKVKTNQEEKLNYIFDYEELIR